MFVRQQNVARAIKNRQHSLYAVCALIYLYEPCYPTASVSKAAGNLEDPSSRSLPLLGSAGIEVGSLLRLVLFLAGELLVASERRRWTATPGQIRGRMVLLIFAIREDLVLYLTNGFWRCLLITAAEPVRVEQWTGQL